MKIHGIILYLSVFTVAFNVSVEETRGSTLRLAIDASDAGTMDPHFASGGQERTAVDMIFNGLLRYNPGNASRIEPDLAESMPAVRMTDGRQVWIFRLKKGVMFQAGPATASYELTAADVVYSLTKSADPKRCAYSGEYANMVFEQVDDYTVRIILSEPLSKNLFLPKMTDYAGGFIVSKRALESMGDKKFNRHPVGTGPFRFESYQPGKKLRLAAHQNYFRGKPQLDFVEILYMPDFKDRIRGLKEGSLDIIRGSLQPGWTRELKKNTNIKIDKMGVGETAVIHFNTKATPLNDIRVRKAIAYGLDRNKFSSLFDKDLTGAVYSQVPVQFLPGGLSQKEVQTAFLDYASDPPKALKLLSEAGYPQGFTLDVISSEMEEYRKTYECIKNQLAQIGIRINIQIVGHSEMHKLIRQDKNPLVVYICWRPNADIYLTRFFHSESIVKSGLKPDTNFSHYDQIDRLIEAARLEIKTEKQEKLWKHAQLKILEDMASYPLYYQNLIYARNRIVDYGHELVNSMALYPQITEETRLLKP